MSELNEILTPSALPMLVLVGALAIAFVRFERAKKDMIGIIADEVKRRGAPEPTPVSVKQPFVVSPEDPPVLQSACKLHMHGLSVQINDLVRRQERREERWESEVKRLHERIDEIPARVITLLNNTKELHSKDSSHG